MYAFSNDIVCSLTDMENSVGTCLNLGKHKKTRGNWIIIKNWENQNNIVYNIFMFWFSFACKCCLNLCYKSKDMDDHSQVQRKTIFIIVN